MKPLPNKSGDCTPTSSNCVVWQGPELCCINLCEGDTISDVIYKEAKVLCYLAEQLDLSDLDISCLTNDCEDCSTDKKLKNILALLIQKVCLLEGGGATMSLMSASSSGDEPILTVASGLRYTDSNGDLVIQLPESEYVELIGSKLSDTMARVSLVEYESGQNSLKIAQLQADMPEPTPIPEVSLPGVMPDSNPYPVQDVVEELGNQFIDLRDATGTPTELDASVDVQPTALASDEALSTSGPMSGISGWVDTPLTIADTITNLWLTVIDMRDALKTVIENTAVSCSDILINYAATVTDNGATVNIFLSGYCHIPNGFADCSPTSTITITDTGGNSYTESLDVTTLSSTNGAYSISLVGTPVNTASDYTVQLDACLTNGIITCGKTVIKQLENNVSVCPQITPYRSGDTISYVMTVPVLSSSITYKVDLYHDVSPIELTATNEYSNPTSTIITGEFTGLSADTYYIVPSVLINGEVVQTCPQITVLGS